MRNHTGNHSVHRTHHQLVQVRIDDLRPTQMTVGMLEVQKKRSEWRTMKRKARTERLGEHWFPAVLGPKERYFIVDHHHLAVALHQEGIETCWVTVLEDLSWVDIASFWHSMEFRGWVHPYDERGRRCEFANLPRRIMGLRNDPYRSLAGLVRAGGGFAKDGDLFSEFLWADYFRTRIPVKAVTGSPTRAVSKALELAHHEDARYLPGWTPQPAPLH